MSLATRHTNATRTASVQTSSATPRRPRAHAVSPARQISYSLQDTPLSAQKIWNSSADEFIVPRAASLSLSAAHTSLARRKTVSMSRLAEKLPSALSSTISSLPTSANTLTDTTHAKAGKLSARKLTRKVALSAKATGRTRSESIDHPDRPRASVSLPCTPAGGEAVTGMNKTSRSIAVSSSNRSAIKPLLFRPAYAPPPSTTSAAAAASSSATISITSSRKTGLTHASQTFSRHVGGARTRVGTTTTSMARTHRTSAASPARSSLTTRRVLSVHSDPFRQVVHEDAREMCTVRAPQDTRTAPTVTSDSSPVTNIKIDTDRSSGVATAADNIENDTVPPAVLASTKADYATESNTTQRVHTELVSDNHHHHHHHRGDPAAAASASAPHRDNSERSVCGSSAEQPRENGQGDVSTPMYANSYRRLSNQPGHTNMRAVPLAPAAIAVAVHASAIPEQSMRIDDDTTAVPGRGLLPLPHASPHAASLPTTPSSPPRYAYHTVCTLHGNYRCAELVPETASLWAAQSDTGMLDIYNALDGQLLFSLPAGASAAEERHFGTQGHTPPATAAPTSCNRSTNHGRAYDASSATHPVSTIRCDDNHHTKDNGVSTIMNTGDAEGTNMDNSAWTGRHAVGCRRGVVGWDSRSRGASCRALSWTPWGWRAVAPAGNTTDAGATPTSHHAPADAADGMPCAMRATHTHMWVGFVSGQVAVYDHLVLRRVTQGQFHRRPIVGFAFSDDGGAGRTTVSGAQDGSLARWAGEQGGFACLGRFRCLPTRERSTTSNVHNPSRWRAECTPQSRDGNDRSDMDGPDSAGASEDGRMTCVCFLQSSPGARDDEASVLSDTDTADARAPWRGRRGSIVLCGFESGAVYLVDVVAEVCVGVLRGHCRRINDLAVIPTDSSSDAAVLFLCAAEDSTVTVWDAQAMLKRYAAHRGGRQRQRQRQQQQQQQQQQYSSTPHADRDGCFSSHGDVYADGEGAYEAKSDRDRLAHSPPPPPLLLLNERVAWYGNRAEEDDTGAAYSRRPYATTDGGWSHSVRLWHRFALRHPVRAFWVDVSTRRSVWVGYAPGLLERWSGYPEDDFAVEEVVRDGVWAACGPSAPDEGHAKSVRRLEPPAMMYGLVRVCAMSRVETTQVLALSSSGVNTVWYGHVNDLTERLRGSVGALRAVITRDCENTATWRERLSVLQQKDVDYGKRYGLLLARLCERRVRWRFYECWRRAAVTARVRRRGGGRAALPSCHTMANSHPDHNHTCTMIDDAIGEDGNRTREEDTGAGRGDGMCHATRRHRSTGRAKGRATAALIQKRVECARAQRCFMDWVRFYVTRQRHHREAQLARALAQSVQRTRYRRVWNDWLAARGRRMRDRLRAECVSVMAHSVRVVLWTRFMLRWRRALRRPSAPTWRVGAMGRAAAEDANTDTDHNRTTTPHHHHHDSDTADCAHLVGSTQRAGGQRGDDSDGDATHRSVSARDAPRTPDTLLSAAQLAVLARKAERQVVYRALHRWYHVCTTGHPLSVRRGPRRWTDGPSGSAVMDRPSCWEENGVGYADIPSVAAAAATRASTDQNNITEQQQQQQQQQQQEEKKRRPFGIAVLAARCARSVVDRQRRDVWGRWRRWSRRRRGAAALVAVAELRAQAVSAQRCFAVFMTWLRHMYHRRLARQEEAMAGVAQSIHALEVGHGDMFEKLQQKKQLQDVTARRDAAAALLREVQQRVRHHETWCRVLCKQRVCWCGGSARGGSRKMAYCPPRDDEVAQQQQQQQQQQHKDPAGPSMPIAAEDKEAAAAADRAPHPLPTPRQEATVRTRLNAEEAWLRDWMEEQQLSPTVLQHLPLSESVPHVMTQLKSYVVNLYTDMALFRQLQSRRRAGAAATLLMTESVGTLKRMVLVSLKLPTRVPGRLSSVRWPLSMMVLHNIPVHQCPHVLNALKTTLMVHDMLSREAVRGLTSVYEELVSNADWLLIIACVCQMRRKPTLPVPG